MHASFRTIFYSALTLAALTATLTLFNTNSSSAAGSPVTLPIGQDTFKIEVNHTGIHEVTYEMLEQAGMQVDSIDPRTFQMMHRGQPVHYQFAGDADASFEPNEKVRFYGWSFDGTRHDFLYTDSSYFWIWADGDADRIGSAGNLTGNPVAQNWPASITLAENNSFTNTFTPWVGQPNEPDAWYWDLLKPSTPFQASLALPHPDPTGSDVQIDAEFLSRRSNVRRTVTVTVGSSQPLTTTWSGIASRNVVGSIDISDMDASGSTLLQIMYDGELTFNSGSVNFDTETRFNEITVDYARTFAADDDELIFEVDSDSAEDYAVTGLSRSSITSYHVWDISEPTTPRAIAVQQSDLNNGTLRFGRNTRTGSFIVSAKTNDAPPVAISKYVPVQTSPTQGAQWVAITHSDFLAETQRLATHRSGIGNLSTHIVDIEDIFNQYGYGYPVPGSMKAYMQNAYDNWSVQPEYLLLVGDTTQNPDQRPCTTCSSKWIQTLISYVPTDLVFVDRSQGLVPSDHTFVTLEGDDLIPDVAVGRIAARTPNDVKSAVDKIIRYDQAVIAEESWTREMMFLADNRDGGGDFCTENQNVDDEAIPADFGSTHLCLDTYLAEVGTTYPNEAAAVTQMRTDIFNHIAASSAGIVNYRGHGSISTWAQNIISRDNTNLWANFNRPVVILSADCLDSNFVFVEQAQSLSETFLMMEGAGSAAHWGSSGLGFSREHTVLHLGFYDAIHEQGNTRIGDVINSSKTNYIEGFGGHNSEIYSFTLHGDPAMYLVNPFTANKLYLPIINR